MGRQINFYFAREDEREFLALPRLKDVLYLRFDNLKTPQYQIYGELDLDPFTEATHDQCLICLPHELHKIHYCPGPDEKFYFISDIQSPVIEYSRGGYRADLNRLISGRVWFQMKYWGVDEDGNDAVLVKSKELESLFNSLVRWVRKHCKRLPKGYYMAPHAMQLYKNGAELC